MDRSYDIFEILPDDVPLWKCAVVGHEKAIVMLRELAAETPNLVRLMHVPTKAVIAEMNVCESRDS